MNAGAGTAPPALVSEATVVVRYEDLRRHILEGCGSRPRLGLAVLVREGLAAWITTVAAATPTAGGPIPDPSGGAALRLGDAAHTDLVHVLAAMALHRYDRRNVP